MKKPVNILLIAFFTFVSSSFSLARELAVDNQINVKSINKNTNIPKKKLKIEPEDKNSEQTDNLSLEKEKQKNNINKKNIKAGDHLKTSKSKEKVAQIAAANINNTKNGTGKVNNCLKNNVIKKTDSAKLVASKNIVKPKKRILIVSSIGGGGHASVANALQSYLKDYDITVTNIFQDIINPVDLMQTFTFKRLSGEDFYNFCLQSRWTGVISSMVSFGSWTLRRQKNAIEKLMIDYLERQNPKFDLILSVMPSINFALINVAHKFDIPFLVLTNDLDTTNYINGIKNPSYKKFYYTLAFEDQVLRDKIACAGIPNSQIKITGFPLRPSFFKPKDKDAIKKEFQVPKDKKVVMLLMGGVGSLITYRYVRIIAKSDLPMHLIVCLGRNEKLRRNISKIALPKNLTLNMIGYTDRIADLMAISDVLITKPGPGSICEALASNLPVIIDKTNGTLWWELANIDFVQDYGFGDVLTNFRDLKNILAKYIKDSDYVAAIKKNISKFKKPNPENSIRDLIKQILS